MARQKFTDKRKRFLVLAERRTNNVLKSLRVLSNCANPALYKFTLGEIEEMFVVIDKAVSEAKGRFRRKRTRGFKFKRAKK